MLVDSNRPASADLAQLPNQTNNPLHPTGSSSYSDDAELSQPNDTISIPLPAVFVLARRLTASPLAVRLWQLVIIWFGFSLVLSRHLGAHGGAENDTTLAWVFDVGLFATAVNVSATAPGLRTAARGGLEKLGCGTTELGQASRRILHRWKVLLTGVGLLWALTGLVSAFQVLFMEGKTSKLTGRVLTPLYLYTVCLAAVPCNGLFLPLIFNVWIYALQYGSLLAGETVDRVIENVERHSPTDPAWQSVVVPGVKMLVRETLPDLSKAFGNTLGYMVLGCWCGAFAWFAVYVEKRALMALVCMIVFTFLPFGIATTVSSTSDKCDELRDKINAKRGDDLTAHLELASLETYMKELNRGQGLGFVVSGIVIDIGMMNRIFSALVSFLVTVVPIILALTPSTVAAYDDTLGACELSNEQQAAIKATAQVVINGSCSYNITLDAIMGA